MPIITLAIQDVQPEFGNGSARVWDCPSVQAFVCFHKSPGCTYTRFLRCEPISSIGNGRVAPDLALLQGARRENIRGGSSTDEQRSSSSVKAGATRRADFSRASGPDRSGLLLSHPDLSGRPCSFVAPCQVLADCQTRQKSARPLPIYELGSRYWRRLLNASTVPAVSLTFKINRRILLLVPQS